MVWVCVRGMERVQKGIAGVVDPGGEQEELGRVEDYAHGHIEDLRWTEA